MTFHILQTPIDLWFIERAFNVRPHNKFIDNVKSLLIKELETHAEDRVALILYRRALEEFITILDILPSTFIFHEWQRNMQQTIIARTICGVRGMRIDTHRFFNQWSTINFLKDFHYCPILQTYHKNKGCIRSKNYYIDNFLNAVTIKTTFKETSPFWTVYCKPINGWISIKCELTLVNVTILAILDHENNLIT